MRRSSLFLSCPFQEEGAPVGLHNLGNTCYVNAALQCLFANHAFRAGVYGLEGAHNVGEPVLRETRWEETKIFSCWDHMKIRAFNDAFRASVYGRDGAHNVGEPVLQETR